MNKILKLLAIVVIAMLVGASSCDDKPAANVAPTTVSFSITATPEGDNINIAVNAKLYGRSKSAALKRVASDLTRMASDLEVPIGPPETEQKESDAIHPETSPKVP